VTAAAAKRRVLFLYNVPDWAIHHVGQDWAGLLAGTHEFTLARFGRHEHEDPARYDHVVWGYSTLRYSGRMLLESLLARPSAWWRWRNLRGGPLAAVVQDPSEVFAEIPDWKRATPGIEHLSRFTRVAVTSHEMHEALAAAGVRTVKVSTRSLLPLRESSALREEPLRIVTRARDYPRKNLALFRAIQSKLTGVAEKCDAILNTTTLRLAEYAAQLDGYNGYICTSWQEGGPLPLRDAQRRGCVVLTTRVGQTDEWVEHGVNGFFCDDEAAFLERARQLAADPALLLRMRRSALERASEPDDERVRHQLREFLP
jgi:glycosyltransferase involved in cell wall biosynthesis